MEFNAPLSGWRANAIAEALARDEPTAVLDVDCGWGELLLRLLEKAPTARGVGIDSDPVAIARGRSNAAARGLSDRVVFFEEGASTDLQPAAVVLSVGSDHAWGSQEAALDALRELVRPGGRLLFGSGFWERPPSTDEAAAVGLKPDSLPDLTGLVDLALAAGLRPLFMQTASRDEWERFESGYLADWEEWLHRSGKHPDASEIRARADNHRNQWLRGYRNVLGFAYLTLGRSDS